MRILNFTANDIIICDDDDEPIRQFPREGNWKDRFHAISGQAQMVVDEIEGVPIMEITLGKVNLPDLERDTYLLVNRIVAEAAAAQGRTTTDLLIPESPVRLAGDDTIIAYRHCRRLNR